MLGSSASVPVGSLDDKEREMADLKLRVDGMDCGGCEESISRAVSRIQGVEAVTADHQTGMVQVAFSGQADEQGVRTAIEDAGYEVVGVGGS
jgi:copper chaperone CopZ